MATAKQQRKLKTLFEQSMGAGGLPAFKTNWEQSIGLHRDESTGVQKFDPAKREVEFKNFALGEVCYSIMGPNWKSNFEQHWVDATRSRFEGVGSAVLPGELSYVSASIDVIAGLMNARALERPLAPEFIWDRFCNVQEASGEGGFEVIIRSAGQQPFQDLADGQPIPTVKLVGSRVHRNRTLSQGLRTKLNKYTVLDDATGTLMEAVDENSLQILNERERKVADCAMGVASGTTLATGESVGIPGQAFSISQDGVQWFPWQKGLYGASGSGNAGAAVVSPQNQRKVQNYGNCGDTDGQGLTDYTCIVRAMQILMANRDPFTGLPVQVDFNGMTFLCAPAARPQVEVLLNARMLWEIANGGFNTSGGTATTSDYNLMEKFNLKIETSQIWMNRLVDLGAYKVSSAGSVTHQALTNALGDSYNTAGSIMSFFMMGHFRKAINYWQRQPYTVQQVPLGSVEYGEETVLVQDVRERGQAYWKDPRIVWRTWA